MQYTSVLTLEFLAFWLEKQYQSFKKEYSKKDQDNFLKTIKGNRISNLAFNDAVYSFAKITKRFGGFVRPCEDFIKMRTVLGSMRDEDEIYICSGKDKCCPILWGVFGDPNDNQEDDKKICIYQGERLLPFESLSHQPTEENEEIKISNIALLFNYVFTILLSEGLIEIDNQFYDSNFKTIAKWGGIVPTCFLSKGQDKSELDGLPFKPIKPYDYKKSIQLQFKFRRHFFSDHSDKLSKMKIDISAELSGLRLDMFQLISLITNGDADPNQPDIAEKSFMCQTTDDVKQLLFILDVAEQSCVERINKGKGDVQHLPYLHNWEYLQKKQDEQNIDQAKLKTDIEYIFASFLIIQDTQMQNCTNQGFFTASKLRNVGKNFKDVTRLARRDRVRGFCYKDILEGGTDYLSELHLCAVDPLLDQKHYAVRDPDMFGEEEIRLPSHARIAVRLGTRHIPVIPIYDQEDDDIPETQPTQEEKTQSIEEERRVTIKEGNMYKEYEQHNYVTCLQNILQIEDRIERRKKVEQAMYAKMILATANYTKEMVECKIMKSLATNVLMPEIDTKARNNWSKTNMSKPLYNDKKRKHCCLFRLSEKIRRIGDFQRPLVNNLLLWIHQHHQINPHRILIG